MEPEKKIRVKELYALLLVMASFGVVMGEVILRYVAGSSLEGWDEIARLLLVWMTFTGIGVVIQDRKEIFVTTLRSRFSERGRRLWQLTLDVVAFLFNLLLIIGGVQMTGFAWSIRSESLELPFSFFYAAIPLGAFAALFYLGRRMIAAWRGQQGEGK